MTALPTTLSKIIRKAADFRVFSRHFLESLTGISQDSSTHTQTQPAVCTSQ